VDTKHKLEQIYVETVVETVIVGIYYQTVRNTRNIRHDYCEECWMQMSSQMTWRSAPYSYN